MKNSLEMDLNLPSKTEMLLFIPLTSMQSFGIPGYSLTRIEQIMLNELFEGGKEKQTIVLKMRKKKSKDTNLY